MPAQRELHLGADAAQQRHEGTYRLRKYLARFGLSWVSLQAH